MAHIDNRKDFLLILLYSPGVRDQPNEPIVGRTRFVKALFLFKAEVLSHFKKSTHIDEEKFYEFFNWNFGPFSSQVYDDLNFFMLRGFIRAKKSSETLLAESAEEWAKWQNDVGLDGQEDVSEYDEEEFLLTEKGVQFAKSLYETLSDNQKQLLREFKKRINNASLRAILKYVYTKYPDTISESVIREKVLGR